MPGIESDSKSAASIITSNQQTTEDNANELLEEQKPIRELTQTDRINKSLLTSFLQRMNTEGFPSQNIDAERNENQAEAKVEEFSD